MITRRKFVGASAAFFGSGPLLASGSATQAGTVRDPRLVLVILRGGLDGLSVLAPYGDRRYQKLRGELAGNRPGTHDGLLPLEHGFALHSRLTNLHNLSLNNEAAFIHAVATPYRDRSHFDGQNILETGLERAYETDTGWLNRSLGYLQAEKMNAFALGQSVPLVLRGSESVSSWSPAEIPNIDGDTLSRLMHLYDEDQFLGPRVSQAYKADEMAGNFRAGRERLFQFVEAAGRFLTHPDGARIAVIESTGWDTHANQTNALNNRLGNLDKAIAQLRRVLAPVWRDTLVLFVTEFGRTAAVNGTRGTDHGTASLAWLLGGPVNGGKLHGYWPGLTDLYEGRDVQPTTDMRHIYSHILGAHLGLPESAIANIFPGLSSGTLSLVNAG